MKEQSTRVFSAISLIGLGIIAYLDWWWPGILFVFGTALLASEVADTGALSFHSGRVIGASLLIAIGLLEEVDFSINGGASWPLILILIGLGILFSRDSSEMPGGAKRKPGQQ
jgi:hypothetical protein